MRCGQAKTGARDGPQPKIGTVECPEVYDEKFLFEYPTWQKINFKNFFFEKVQICL